jgi:Fe-S-cluster-containing dehydrogenase component
MDGIDTMSKQWYLVIDVEKCENCGNCLLSCKDEHVGNDWPGYTAPQPAHGGKWIDVRSKERGQYPFIDVAYLPVPCMHCDQAPCIKSAKPGSIVKRADGIVLIDPGKAKGQRNIVASCPYGAISWNNELGMPQKCTLCAHLLDGGWTKTRCVQSCPTGALSLLHVDEAGRDEMIREGRLEVYLPDHGTRPRVYYMNLKRFTHCFIAGSAAVRNGTTEDCAEGAEVVLRNAKGETVADCRTDNYGDFKFDGLEKNSGKYSITIRYGDRDLKTAEYDLKESLNVGILYI